MVERTVWFDCLGPMPDGREVDYITGLLADDGVEVDDVELHPGRRAAIYFRSDTDRSDFMSRSWGSHLASIPGIIVRGLTDWFFGSGDEVAELAIPRSVYKAISKNRDMQKKLEEYYGSVCLDSKSSGSFLRGPAANITSAYEFLQHQFAKEFAASPKAKAASDSNYGRGAGRGAVGAAKGAAGAGRSAAGAGRGAAGAGRGAAGAGRGASTTAGKKYCSSDRPKARTADVPGSGSKMTSAPPNFSGPRRYDILAPKYVVKYILKNYPHELYSVCQRYAIKYEVNELDSSYDEIEIIIRPMDRDCTARQFMAGYEKFKELYAKYHYTTRKKTLCVTSGITAKLGAVRSRYPRVLLTERPSRRGDHAHLDIIGTENDVNRVYYSLSAPAKLPHPRPEFDPMTFARVDGASALLASDLDELDEVASLRFREKATDQVQLEEVKIFQLPNQGTKILLYQGSIIKQNVEAIANATDRNLRHDGGVSLVISSAAGPALNRECGEYIAKYGPLRYGEVAVSGGHKLPVKYIFNAAGPDKRYTPRASDVLEDTCYNIFRLADKYKVASIAVPTISTGLLMMTKDEFAVAFCEAIIAYSSDTKQSGLQTICVVDVDTSSVLDMSDTFDKILVPHGASKSVVDKKSLDSLLAGSTAKKPAVDERADEAMDTSTDERIPETGPLPGDSARNSVPGGAVRTTDDEGGTTADIDSSCKRDTRTGVGAHFDGCPICYESMDTTVSLPCGHKFCQACIDKTFQTQKICPICREVIEVVAGNQPDGTMEFTIIGRALPGYPNRDTIVIMYHFPDGIQTDRHPKPGQPYTGTVRYAYLPYNTKGKKVYRLLRQAFDRKLVFTVGTSITTGQENVVIWNDIHHKTRMDGGPHSFGYPDPTYLDRVTEELAARGIKETPSSKR